MTNTVRALWTEPRAANPPERVWRDWAVVVALIGIAVLEQALRPDMPWRPIAALEVVYLALVLLWRRTHPLAMMTLGFGMVIVVDVASIAGSTTGPVSPYSMAFLLFLPYALFRWGSGREAVLGSTIALVAYFVGLVRDHTSLSDALIGFVILLFPAVLGASVRFWTTSRTRELDQVRLREREQLARELHDTVAHHVSAMVIRAQAGRVVAASDPDAAVEALKVIEAEGSRTLAEMRTMVGALRERDEVDYAPVAAIADIRRLAVSEGALPLVEVHLSGKLDGIDPSVGAAMYRIAQESVTNARRHARHATRIDVRVTGAETSLQVCVRDDGESVTGVRAIDGYGVVGMTERAMLLGGTLEAGPGRERGWVVNAVVPRMGAGE
ncbi:MAG: histidine kinase [Actinomycetia bacterium]|nr:histidine kinase [Actinomycetes bacterium]